MVIRPLIGSSHALLGLVLLLGLSGCGQEPGGEPRGDGAAAAVPGGGADDRPSSPTLPPIRVMPATLDWGTVAPNEEVLGSVRLQNLSDQPQTILSVQPSCKCTTTDSLDGTVIPPRGELVLEATLDAQPNPGTRSTVIRVLFEGYSKVLSINATADVARPIRVEPPFINAVDGENLSGTISVSSLDGKPFNVVSFQGAPPRILGLGSGSTAPSEDDGPRERYVLTYDLASHLQSDGRYPRFLVVETDHPDEPLTEVLVRHRLSRPELSPYLKLTDYKANLGRIRAGDSVEHVIGANEGGAVGAIIQVVPEPAVAGEAPPPLLAEVLTQSVDGASDELSATVKFSVPAGTPPGFHYGMLQIYASNQASLGIPVFFTVVSEDEG